MVAAAGDDFSGDRSPGRFILAARPDNDSSMASRAELNKGFKVGPWEVLPDRGLIRDGERREHLEPLVMKVLVALASEEGNVLSKDELIERVWDGRAQSDEPLNRCISVLRRKLGDDSRKPTFIENIPRRGYRLMVPVLAIAAAASEPAPRRNWLPWIAGGAAIAVFVAVFVTSREPLPTPLDAPMQSIAIFPFSCAGTAAEYLCFGFSEELTSTLLRAEQLKIVKSGKPYPADRTPQDIAHSLGVDGLLKGSVQQSGEQLKIAAELVDGRNGFVVLSDTLEGSVTEVFDLQERVAAGIERSISGDTGPPLEAASEPSSFAAFEAYARGQYQFERRSRASIQASIDLFEETIRLDPLFGPAYLRLAYAYLLLPEYDSALSIEAMYDLAQQKTLQGIDADPSIREPAGTVFGFIHHKRGEWREASEAFETAINAETASPLAHHWYSRFLATVGRMDEALQHSELAYELDPDSAIIISRLAITNFWVSNLAAAGRYFDIANTMDQDSPIHDLAYALYLIRIGDITAARGYTKAGLEKYGFDASWVDAAFDGIEDPSLRDETHELVAALEADGRLAKYIVMTLWALLGDADRAMATAFSIEGIGQQFETGFEMMFSDELEILREHEDFPRLLDEIGLTRYWSEVGCRREGGRVRCE